MRKTKQLPLDSNWGPEEPEPPLETKWKDKKTPETFECLPEGVFTALLGRGVEVLIRFAGVERRYRGELVDYVPPAKNGAKGEVRVYGNADREPNFICPVRAVKAIREA